MSYYLFDSTFVRLSHYLRMLYYSVKYGKYHILQLIRAKLKDLRFIYI